jgi:ectoine hydroxylase-related dioxygenase (phytanoyl-CoA dioxygenase family)
MAGVAHNGGVQGRRGGLRRPLTTKPVRRTLCNYIARSHDVLVESPPRRQRLTSETIAAFHRDGFTVLPRVTTVEDLDRISRILARLYRRYNTLARERRAWDLGIAADGAAPEILEINQTIALEPELEATPTFQACRAIAEQLLGRAVEYRFDHSIYKPAFNGRATAWHQDEAYTLDPRLVTAHFWVPMHDVSVERGCMQFIPGSHRGDVRPHHRLQHLRHAHALEADDVDTSRAVACPLRAGDVTVHMPRTLHYTGPNQTPMPRLAWSLEFGPRKALPARVVAKARLVWRRGLPGPRQTGALAVAVCSRARRSMASIFTSGTSTQASAVTAAEIKTNGVKP